MKMAIGSDTSSHLTESICSYLEANGVEIVRCGRCDQKDCDYVDAAREVAELVRSGACAQGLIFCWTGTGVTIVANKVPGVRAALCVDTFSARIARLANNANVIVLGIRLTGEPLAREILETWLATAPSDEPRRKRFHEKTDELDRLYRGVPGHATADLPPTESVQSLSSSAANSNED
jgi:RpiB/LacA/LacB family sugar-phosphate isomerase